jgi:acyl carrier protein
MTDDTLTTVKRIVAEKLEIDEDALTPEMDIASIIGDNSLAGLELVFGLEEAYEGIEVDPSEIQQITTITDIAAIIDRLRS